jgi:hypothetical protein
MVVAEQKDWAGPIELSIDPRPFSWCSESTDFSYVRRSWQPSRRFKGFTRELIPTSNSESTYSQYCDYRWFNAPTSRPRPDTRRSFYCPLEKMGRYLDAGDPPPTDRHVEVHVTMLKAERFPRACNSSVKASASVKSKLRERRHMR